jgi:hypothetical protein
VRSFWDNLSANVKVFDLDTGKELLSFKERLMNMALT